MDSDTNVRMHKTPTYSSWLNQVELWFAKCEPHCTHRGIFTSVKDLARKLMRYIRLYNKAPKPVKWTYRNVSRATSRGVYSDAMSPMLAELKEKASQLSETERAELALALIESL